MKHQSVLTYASSFRMHRSTIFNGNLTELFPAGCSLLGYLNWVSNLHRRHSPRKPISNPPIIRRFVLESSKNLQPDQAKATVLAIQSLTSAIQAGTNNSTVPATGPSDDSFKPTLLTIWVNCLWFLSLGLSISVSLFAMLAKRWCYVFRSKRTGSSHERAIKRQKSWDAIEKWKIELVIEQLPTLMHIALSM